MNSDLKKVDQFLKKLEQFKKGNFDLSLDEDLSLAVMNLIAIEEHLFFTGAKTQKNDYFDLIKEIRSFRKPLMKQLITQYEGEVWCISKHLLAATMRLNEVGTKLLDSGKDQQAQEMFLKAYQLYSLFWGLKLKMVNLGSLKKISDQQLNKHDQKTNFLGKLGEIVRKVVDCCIE